MYLGPCRIIIKYILAKIVKTWIYRPKTVKASIFQKISVAVSKSPVYIFEYPEAQIRVHPLRSTSANFFGKFCERTKWMVPERVFRNSKYLEKWLKIVIIFRILVIKIYISHECINMIYQFLCMLLIKNYGRNRNEILLSSHIKQILVIYKK